MCLEFFRSPNRIRGSLRVEETDDPLYFDSFPGKMAAHPVTGGVLDIPAGVDQTEKSLLAPEAGLHSKMCQIMQDKMPRMFRLFLPRERAILTRAAQYSSTIWLFDDLDL